MFTLLSLSLRNVFRAKARSAMTIGALFFGVFMSLVLGSFLFGLGEAIVTDTIETRLGAIQVHRKGYFDARNRQPLSLDLEHGGELEKKLRGVPGVSGVTPRIIFSGFLSNGTNGTMFVGQAVEPRTELDALPGAAKYVQGERLSEQAPRAALVGRELAQALNAKKGDTLLIQGKGPGGRENALDVDVQATIAGATPLDGKRVVTLTLPHAQSLLGMKGRVTEYVVGVTDREEIDQVSLRLQALLGPEYEVHTWSELRPAVAQLIQMQRVILGVVSFVFLIIAVFGVANTLLMSVMERTKEIGTLLAVGMKRAQIASLFVAEAGFQALIGGAVGWVLASVVVFTLRERGGVLIPMGEGQDPFAVIPSLPTPFLVIAMVTVVVGALLAALYPAYSAARLRPVEALTSH